jgi:colanic acid biosynthesis glycosyl transferase WcaI
VKILVHTIFYRPELTGVAKYTAELCEWLVAQGHDVHVVAPPPYYPQWRVQTPYRQWGYASEVLNGVHVRRCPIWLPKRPGGLGRILYGLSFLLASLPAMLREVWWAPDLVLAIEPSFLNSTVAWPVARISGASAWLHIQDFEVDLAFDMGQLRLGRGIVERGERWLLKRFDVVSSISHRMLDKARAKGIKQDRLYLFPNWFNPATIHPLRESSALRSEFNIPDDAVVVLFSGSLGTKQGVETIVEAARILRGDRRLFFLISGEGVGLEALRTQAEGLDNIRFAPLQPAERLNDLLNVADIHLLPQQPSASDSVMPSKLIGMLASGRPVVAAARASTEIALLVENCGLIVEPGDPKALASALLSLGASQSERGRLGEQARETAMKLFSQHSIFTGFEVELRRRMPGHLASEGYGIR